MRNVLVLLWGLGLAPVTAQWSPVAPLGAPPAQAYPAMAFDTVRAETVLFGANQTDTWCYDGAAWTQRATVAAPPARAGHAMVFDQGRGVVVLYGGYGATAGSAPCLDDTWQWDGVTWTQLQPSATPNGRARFGLSFDLARQRVVLFGGTPNVFTNLVLGDTWEFDGTTWTLAAPLNSPPPRERAAMCYMASLGRSVLFGGTDPRVAALSDTWLYDGTNWVVAPPLGPSPTARINARLVDVLTRGVCTLVGGADEQTLAIFNETWEFDGAVWRSINSQVSPPRTGAGVVQDFVRNRLVLFGGTTASTALRSDTWEFGSSYRSYGHGCAGSNGVPTLTAVQAPRFGAICRVTLGNLAPTSTVAILTTGLSNATSQLGALPVSLSSLGLTGCVAYASAELFQPLVATSGQASWTWSVPNQPGLFGQSFYQQGIALDPGANPAGAVVSNAGVGTLGW